jgi:hypothetical protein
MRTINFEKVRLLLNVIRLDINPAKFNAEMIFSTFAKMRFYSKHTALKFALKFNNYDRH